MGRARSAASRNARRGRGAARRGRRCSRPARARARSVRRCPSGPRAVRTRTRAASGTALRQRAHSSRHSVADLGGDGDLVSGPIGVDFDVERERPLLGRQLESRRRHGLNSTRVCPGLRSDSSRRNADHAGSSRVPAAAPSTALEDVDRRSGRSRAERWELRSGLGAGPPCPARSNACSAASAAASPKKNLVSRSADVSESDACTEFRPLSIPKQLADRALGRLRRVGRADHLAQAQRTALALERGQEHRTRGHVVDELAEERALLVLGVERLGLLARERARSGRRRCGSRPPRRARGCGRSGSARRRRA